MARKHSDDFGKLDLGWDDAVDSEPTPSGVRPSEGRTRIVPSVQPESGPKKRPSQEMTRVGSVGSAAGAADKSAPASVRDPRIDELRKLYAKGDADAALKFAEGLGSGGAEPYSNIQDDGGVDIDVSIDRSADPSIIVETGEAEIDMADLEEPYDAGPEIDVSEGTAIFAAPKSLRQVTAMTGTPYVTMVMSEVSRLPLDPKAGFLIQMIDGASSIADLCDLAGMPEDEVTAVLSDLASHKVIDFK